MKNLIFSVLVATLMLHTGVNSIKAQTLADAVNIHQLSENPALISREKFTPDAVIRFPVLSPNGKFLAYAEKEGKQLNLNILFTESSQTRTLFNTNRLLGLSWTADGNKLILELDNSIGYLNVATNSRPSYIMSLDRQSGDYFLRSGSQSDDTILAVTKENNTYYLKQVRFDGSVENIFQTSGRIVDATSSFDGSVWFLKIVTTNTQSIYELKDRKLVEIVSCDVVDTCELDYFDDSDRVLWLRSSTESDLFNLYGWSEKNRELVFKHSDPVASVDIRQVEYLNNQPKIVQYHDSTLNNYGLDEETQLHIDRLNSIFDASNLSIDMSNIGIWFITEDSSIMRDSRYYLYNLADKDVTEVLTEYRSNDPIDPKLLSRKIPFRYPASENTLINAYLSLPKGKILSKAPLVTIVHGGPWGRNYSDYHETIQRLVNQGYIVFSPNFRASKGYGKNFVLSANKDFGNGVVQQDILDGIEFLTNQGIGDPDKLAIVGSSFGGFAVLTGLAFSPDLFKVGIALAPPADMENVSRYVESRVKFGDYPLEKEQHRLLLVDLDNPEEVAALYAKSPYANLSNITAPLLVIAGADDERVGIAHVKDYTLQLLNMGKEITAVIDDDEGHIFTEEESTAATRYLIDEFLSLYLGGSVEELTGHRLKDYLLENVRINSNSRFLNRMDIKTLR